MKRAILTMALGLILIAAPCLAPDLYGEEQRKTKPATIWDTVTAPDAGISVSSRMVIKAPKKLLSLVFAPDGGFLANSADEVYIWSPEAKLVKVLPVKSTSISFVQGGHYLVTAQWKWNNGGKMTVWNTADWTPKAQAMGLGKGIGALTSSLVAAWRPWEDDLVIWNFETGEKRKIWSGPHGKMESGSVFQPYTWQSVIDASFSPDGRFVAIAREAHKSDDQLVIIEVASGSKERAFFNCRNKTNILASVEYSAKGTLIVTNGGQCEILVREADTGVTLGRFKNENKWEMPEPRFTPDGRYVFFLDRRGAHFRYSDGSKGGLDIAEARQVDTASGADCKLEITEEKLSEAGVTKARYAFSTDGKRMAWIENDNVHIWDIQGIGPGPMH